MTLRKSLKAAFILVLALTVVFTMSSAAFAVTNQMTKSEALDIALKDAGLTKSEVKNIEKEYDDGYYEVEFTKAGTRKEYDYKINKSGKIIKKSVDFNRPKNTGRKKLTKDDAIDKVVAFSGFKKSLVKSGTVVLEKDDGEWVYEVKFSTRSNRYEYDVHGRTGKILEYTRKAIN